MRKLATIIVLLVWAGGVSAQQTDYTATNTWFTMLNTVKFTPKWSFSLETHERLGAFFKDQGQFLLRPSVDFAVNPNVVFSVGYTYINVQPYPPSTLPIRKVEKNLWEQVLLKYSVGKFDFQNRLREENRWVDHIDFTDSVYTAKGTDYANRMRFRWTVKRDIVGFKNGHKLFFQGFDEIWIAQDKNLMPVNFARNWMYLGLGYGFSKNLNIQVGYMNQFDRVGNNSYISTPILQTTLVANFDLIKK